ncbi:hypothetical protein VSR01_37470 [Actinacidiphila sp. DG2A-62]|uniref:hypothetical protein n=1 Tax=Actinacidiphila sp. DG2A-62 TaxID=3108821 RepID=UPI002DBD9AF7|nr:hypothetical protein [Actinacidiphila sp. DG2A-62]MEC3998873.1 hypothetical protein [Actinacidiphila sp. DG2A-62]
MHRKAVHRRASTRWFSITRSAQDPPAALGISSVNPQLPPTPVPAGLICHGPLQGYRRSAKALRTGVRMEPKPTPYGPQPGIRGILPVPAP